MQLNWVQITKKCNFEMSLKHTENKWACETWKTVFFLPEFVFHVWKVPLNYQRFLPMLPRRTTCPKWKTALQWLQEAVGQSLRGKRSCVHPRIWYARPHFQREHQAKHLAAKMLDMHTKEADSHQYIWFEGQVMPFHTLTQHFDKQQSWIMFKVS